MGFNSGKIKVQSTAKKKTKNSPWSKDILMDPAGQLKFPGQPTRIPGNTMSTNGYGNIPLMVYPDVGPTQMIPPNSGNHTFAGANYFDEFPMMAAGGAISDKISKLMAEGYPQKQAIAIAYDMQRRGQLPKHQNIGETGQEDRPVNIVALPEFQVVGGQEGEDFPYYNTLNAEQQKLFRDPGAIGRGIRSQATHGYGLDGNPSFTQSVYDFAGAFPKMMGQTAADAFAVPQAYAVEEVERLRGNPYNYENVIGNQLKEFGVEGYQQRLLYAVLLGC